MRKFYLFFIISLLLSSTITAQNRGRIRATVVDEQTKEAIVGAVIEVESEKDTSAKTYFHSGQGGAMEIANQAYGNYMLRVSFIGYNIEPIGVSVDRQTVDLDTIFMTPRSEMLAEVVTSAQAMRTSQKGDTIIYNAAAFKVSKDADTESLLSKMPGIKILDGEVEAQGETVKKIYVDGKEFFGQDVTTAIRNLPAEIVDKIEIYDKLSDQSEFSGVDDGEGHKALNIVTAVKSGQFGKMYAGYGFNDKYIAGANINIFKGDSRIAIMGMANNMNQQNFSIEDILDATGGGGRGGGRGGMRSFMVGRQAGISTVQSFGVNYNDTWGKKVDVAASYFFNNSKNENYRTSRRENVSDTPSYLLNIDTTDYEAKNMEHRFNGRLDYKISDSQNLMWRPSFSFQNYRNTNEGWGSQYRVEDAIENLLSDRSSNNLNRNWGYNFSNNLTYRIRLGKPGRTISANAYMSFRRNDGKGNSQTETIRPGSIIDNRQLNQNYTKSLNLSGNVMYTEPITEHAQINAQYRVSYNYSDADRKVNVWDPTANEGNGDYIFSDPRSSIYNSGYLTQSIGPGFNYSKDRNVFTANVSYQKARLVNDQETPIDRAGKQRYSFDDVVYFAMINKMFNPGTSLRIHARSDTRNPSVSQLQEIVSDADQLNISTGNPDLDPSYSHNVYANFNKSNVTKGRTFMLSAGFGYQTNYITDYTYINSSDDAIVLTDHNVTLLPGGRFSKPINMDGDWNVNTNVSYGFPVNFIKSNLNFNLGARFNEAPTMYNDEKSKRQGQYYNAGLVLGSNISDKVDFTIHYNAGYNNVSNTNTSENSYASDNEYFNHAVSTRFKFTFWAGLTFSGSAAYSQYKGISDKNYDEDYLIVNLYLGKKVFKNQRGEIVFGVNDLFNQETGYSRSVRDTYIEDVRNKSMGRYFGLQFVYNLRNFGKASSAPRGSGDSLRGGGRPPMGGPPHGGMGGRY